jgi:hypothetical protein
MNIKLAKLRLKIQIPLKKGDSMQFLSTYRQKPDFRPSSIRQQIQG